MYFLATATTSRRFALTSASRATARSRSADSSSLTMRVREVGLRPTWPASRVRSLGVELALRRAAVFSCTITGAPESAATPAVRSSASRRVGFASRAFARPGGRRAPLLARHAAGLAGEQPEHLLEDALEVRRPVLAHCARGTPARA